MKDVKDTIINNITEMRITLRMYDRMNICWTIQTKVKSEIYRVVASRWHVTNEIEVRVS